MAQAVGRRPRRPGFDPRPVHARFVVDKVELGQVCPPVLQFSISIMPPMLHVKPFIFYSRYLILAAELSLNMLPPPPPLSATVRTLQTSHILICY
jgi:hypothetical protein